MMKKMKSIMLAALALAAVSCVYPFSAETEDGSGALVIEGDIYVGELTTVTLGYTSPINGVPHDPPFGEVWVEDDAGTMYHGVRRNKYSERFKSQYDIDTRHADPGREYRLHVRMNDRSYESEWAPVCPPPEIDSLSYLKVPEKETLNITLSMHSQKGSFFKWSYVEDWEYHSDYFASLKLENSIGKGMVIVPMVYPENTYYCFKHAVSTEILTFSTEKQTDDRFVDLEFHKIPRTDDRLSYLYRIRVALEPLSKDAYTYWENIKANSDYSGSLFAPTPSEMVGNIRCVEDPGEFVFGFINVAQRAVKTLYLDALDVRYYKRSEPYVEGDEVASNQWRQYIMMEYLPYSSLIPGDYSTTYWAPARCVDCRKRGGTKERPEDWPLIHW